MSRIRLNYCHKSVTRTVFGGLFGKWWKIGLPNLHYDVFQMLGKVFKLTINTEDDYVTMIYILTIIHCFFHFTKGKLI